jgi:hypothetical protein
VVTRAPTGRRQEGTVRTTTNPIDDGLLARVKSEFMEMPGLRLTAPQARRLWGLDEARCDELLTALIDAQFLFRTRDGAFMRIERAKATRERPAAAPRSAVA